MMMLGRRGSSGSQEWIKAIVPYEYTMYFTEGKRVKFHRIKVGEIMNKEENLNDVMSDNFIGEVKK
jgi:hypothetical protein